MPWRPTLLAFHSLCIGPDEAQDSTGSDGFQQDAAHKEAKRSKILSTETFDTLRFQAIADKVAQYSQLSDVKRW